MTARRISISLPDDVAERLDREDNASAYVAGAVRARMRREQIRGILADAGIDITREGVDRMRERVHALEQRRAARHDAA
jgi:metal-responsive CopG/Arc/MetJ family transcriptional regulator